MRFDAPLAPISIFSLQGRRVSASGGSHDAKLRSAASMAAAVAIGFSIGNKRIWDYLWGSSYFSFKKKSKQKKTLTRSASPTLK
jgi:hypothetical protein